MRKRHILRSRRLVIPLLTITLIIYLNIVSICSYLLCNLIIWCLRNVQNFIYVSKGVLILWRQSTNFLITPRSYTYFLTTGKCDLTFKTLQMQVHVRAVTPLTLGPKIDPIPIDKKWCVFPQIKYLTLKIPNYIYIVISRDCLKNSFPKQLQI